MISSEKRNHHLLPYSEIRGLTTSITDEDPVILIIESKRRYQLELPRDEISLIIQDPELDKESFTLNKLLNREVSILRTEKDYRILVKGGKE